MAAIPKIDKSALFLFSCLLKGNCFDALALKVEIPNKLFSLSVFTKAVIRNLKVVKCNELVPGVLQVCVTFALFLSDHADHASIVRLRRCTNKKRALAWAEKRARA